MRRYDQTIRQLLGENPELIIRSLTGVGFGKLHPTDHKMQMLLEREPDFIRCTEGPDGKPLVLHVEFQTGNDKEMPYRMLEYYAAARRKFKHSIWQYVVYIGEKPMRMDSQLKDRHNYFAYQVIDIGQIPFQIFLEHPDPGLLPWTVLANHGDKPSKEVIASTAARIITSTEGDKNLQTRQLTALVMFSSLRNLDQVTQQIIKTMPFDEEKIWNSYVGKLYRRKVQEKMWERLQVKFENEVVAKWLEEREAEVRNEVEAEVRDEVVGKWRNEMQAEMRNEVEAEVRDEITLTKESMAISLMQLDSLSLQEISNITGIEKFRLMELQANIDD